MKLKRYFYVLRPVLACRWILDRHTPPPVPFSRLADACLDEALLPAVNELLRMKMQTPELGAGQRIHVIDEYLEASIEELERLISAMRFDERVAWDELNLLFLKTIGIKL